MESHQQAGPRTSHGPGRVWRSVAPAVVLGGVLAGCASSSSDAPAPDPGSAVATTMNEPASEPSIIEDTLEVDGRPRSYRLVVPSSANAADATPLVIILHGNGTDAASIAEKTGFDAVAQGQRFLAVYPEVDEDAGVWNGGFSSRADDVDDVAFLKELVVRIGDRYAVDPDRVFATGMSSGGMMAYRLACEAPELVAAIAPVAATMVVDCDPAVAVSVLHLHGIEDRSIPVEGREGRGFPPVRDVLDTWAVADGCGLDPKESTDGPVATTTWTGCDRGIDVQLMLLQGRGHEYPRTETGAPIDGPTTVWEFFAQHPKPR